MKSEPTSENLLAIALSRDRLVEKLRCGAARRLLVHTDMEYEEIAKTVGHPDLATLADICLSHTGYTLAELRQVERLALQKASKDSTTS